MRKFIFLWLFACGAHAAPLADTVSAIKPAIVAIGTFQADRAPPLKFLGTGFAVADGRHAVTNFHVVSSLLDVEHHERLVAFTGNGDEAQVSGAEKVRVDEAHDLALLKLDGPVHQVVHFGDSSSLREGDALAFTGFPIGVVLGYYPVTHRATLSAITPIVVPVQNARDLSAHSIRQMRTPFRVFQLDATAYPGNSGSPLYLEDSGKVVGIVNLVFVKKAKESVLSDPSGIAYAIPGDYIVDLVRSVGLDP